MSKIEGVIVGVGGRRPPSDFVRAEVSQETIRSLIGPESRVGKSRYEELAQWCSGHDVCYRIVIKLLKTVW